MIALFIVFLFTTVKTQSISTNQIKCASSGAVNPVFSGGTSTWTLTIPTGSQCAYVSYKNQVPNPGTGQVYPYVAVNLLKNTSNIGTFVNENEFYNTTAHIVSDINTVYLTQWDSVQLQVSTTSSLCSSLNVVPITGGSVGTITVSFPTTCVDTTTEVQVSNQINPISTERSTIATGSNHIYLISNQAQFQGGLCETLTLSNNMWLFIEPTYDVYINPYTFQVSGYNYTVFNNGVFSGEYSISPYAQIYLDSTATSVEICIYANTQLGVNRMLGIVYII